MSDKGNYTDPVYSHRIIRRPFAISLAITCSGVFLLIASIIYFGMFHETHWGTYAVTCALVCSVLLFFPPVEEWVYRPWQKQAQKVEQHHYD